MSEETHAEQPDPAGPTEEAPQTVYRHWLTELAHKAADGSVAAAAGYLTKKAMDKMSGGGPGKGTGGEGEPSGGAQGDGA